MDDVMGPFTQSLYCDVGDDSSALEKALFHAIAALDDIDKARPMVNNPQHVAARALEAVERALKEGASAA